MAFHRNNNGQNNRYNNRQNFRPRHNNNQHNNQQGGQRRHVNRINHVFESNGPDGRVRGTAQQLVEKYNGLARDAHANGDAVLMLNYYQHAEHYQRLYAEIVEENTAFEREREASRAQFNQQPMIEGDAAMAGQAPHGDIQANPPAQPPQPQPMQQRPAAEMAPAEQNPAPAADQTSGSNATGGRVMGRRPARTDGNRPHANQLQDDHMPSFLKQDIPIKQGRAPTPAQAGDTAEQPAVATPVVAQPAETGEDAPAAAFGKRRAPARRTASKDAPDAE